MRINTGRGTAVKMSVTEIASTFKKAMSEIIW
jgi:hypothetical protein